MEIENITQLNAEIRRLKAKSADQREQLKEDFEEIKEELKPKNILLDVASDITGFKINRDSLFQKGFAFALSLLLGRLLKKTGLGFEKQAGSLIHKLTTWVSGFVKKFFKKKHAAGVNGEDDGHFAGE